MRALRRKRARIAAALALFAAGFVFGRAWWLFAAAWALAGYDVLWKAVRGLLRAQLLDENLLMAVASAGALAMGEFSESAAVMIFYQVGELFQDYAVRRSRKSISALMALRPDTARVREADGSEHEMSPEQVPVGALIVLRPGERVPLDGVVVEGASALDTAALTGESLPREAAVGDEVLSGCVCLSGALTLRVTRGYEQSAVSRILELVEEAAGQKASSERFITRFARWYTPTVVGAAVLLAVLPSLLLGQWRVWLHRALLFLVVSCPCALVISVPLSFFGGIGGASRRGILVKGGSALEALAKVDTVVFDKTGTLTGGVFEVTDVLPQSGTAQELLTLAARAEQSSNHPIARSLRDAAGMLPQGGVEDVHEQAGGGVRAVVDGHTVLVGNARLLAAEGITAPEVGGGTAVFAARDGEYLGCVLVADRARAEAAGTLAALRRLGVRRLVMLTGDHPAAAEQIAAQLGMDELHAGLLPEQKVQFLKEELAHRQGAVAFVGDGINDAPVLALADVGVAMGGFGSDAAIEAADAVLMADRLDRLPTAVRIGRKTVAVARQNIVFALAVKALILLLGALGRASMWAAVFADVGVAVIAICNALRTMRLRD